MTITDEHGQPLSDEETIRLYMEWFDLGEDDATKMLMLEKGEIGGDIIQVNPDGSETTFLPQQPGIRQP